MIYSPLAAARKRIEKEESALFRAHKSRAWRGPVERCVVVRVLLQMGTGSATAPLQQHVSMCTFVPVKQVNSVPARAERW